MVVDTIESSPQGEGLRIGIVVSLWYRDVTDRLREAAIETARVMGVAPDQLFVVEVPGAYELPQAASWLVRSDRVDAIVALGCIVRGATPHFDHVARACVDGLQQLSLESGIPVGLGVITAETEAQANERSGDAQGKGGNKGIEAMDAAVRMARTYAALEARDAR